MFYFTIFLFVALSNLGFGAPYKHSQAKFLKCETAAEPLYYDFSFCKLSDHACPLLRFYENNSVRYFDKQTISVVFPGQPEILDVTSRDLGLTFRTDGKIAQAYNSKNEIIYKSCTFYNEDPSQKFKNNFSERFSIALQYKFTHEMLRWIEDPKVNFNQAVTHEGASSNKIPLHSLTRLANEYPEFHEVLQKLVGRRDVDLNFTSPLESEHVLFKVWHSKTLDIFGAQASRINVNVRSAEGKTLFAAYVDGRSAGALLHLMQHWPEVEKDISPFTSLGQILPWAIDELNYSLDEPQVQNDLKLLWKRKDIDVNAADLEGGRAIHQLAHSKYFNLQMLKELRAIRPEWDVMAKTKYGGSLFTISENAEQFRSLLPYSFPDNRVEQPIYQARNMPHYVRDFKTIYEVDFYRYASFDLKIYKKDKFWSQANLWRSQPTGLEFPAFVFDEKEEKLYYFILKDKQALELHRLDINNLTDEISLTLPPIAENSTPNLRVDHKSRKLIMQLGQGENSTIKRYDIQANALKESGRCAKAIDGSIKYFSEIGVMVELGEEHRRAAAFCNFSNGKFTVTDLRWVDFIFANQDAIYFEDDIHPSGKNILYAFNWKTATSAPVVPGFNFAFHSKHPDSVFYVKGMEKQNEVYEWNLKTQSEKALGIANTDLGKDPKFYIQNLMEDTSGISLFFASADTSEGRSLFSLSENSTTKVFSKAGVGMSGVRLFVIPTKNKDFIWVLAENWNADIFFVDRRTGAFDEDHESIEGYYRDVRKARIMYGENNEIFVISGPEVDAGISSDLVIYNFEN